MENKAMTAVAFRHNMTETIGQINRGQTVTITHYSRPIAAVVPIEWFERAVRALFNAEVNDPEGNA